MSKSKRHGSNAYYDKERHEDFLIDLSTPGRRTVSTMRSTLRLRVPRRTAPGCGSTNPFRWHTGSMPVPKHTAKGVCLVAVQPQLWG